MYRTRLHFDRDNMHISLDPLDGAFLELYTYRDCDNIIQNQMNELHKPFVLRVDSENGMTEYFPVQTTRVIQDMSLAPVITSEETDGGLLVTVAYAQVTDGEAIIPCDVRYTILLHGDRADFSIRIANGFDQMMREVTFPVIPGVILGDTYEDNTLVLPRQAGQIVPNASKTLAEPYRSISWRWQEYRSHYTLSGFSGSPMGKKGYSAVYPGDMSMSWVDLSNGKEGLYFACHDPLHKTCRFDVASNGEAYPGVAFATTFMPRLAPGSEYTSPATVLMLHPGDWHAGARVYRDFRRPYIAMREDRFPCWAQEGQALFAHYDFMYQNKRIVHMYRDIPELVDFAVESGVNHLLFSGWNYDGFDHGFPMYTYNPELGTEQELIDGIAYAKSKGVHVSFYVNICLHNEEYEADTIDQGAIHDEHGNRVVNLFGNKDICFDRMCPASDAWHDRMTDTAKLISDTYGVDGVYFDMLSVPPLACFNKLHNHPYDAWNDGQLRILNTSAANYRKTHDDGMLLMGEWLTDFYGGTVSYQLNQLWFTTRIGGSLDVYRYTFPEHGVVDMIYPRKNQAMRCSHVARRSEQLMASVFTTGTYFWLYDLEEDNTFRRDPESFAIAKEIIALRKIQVREAADYLYVDTDGISVSSDAVRVRRFAHEDGRSVLVAYRFAAGETVVSLDAPVHKAVAVTCDGRFELPVQNGCITLPDAKACLVFLA